MKYKKSSSEEIAKRNAKAYLGTAKMQEEAMKKLKKWLEG